MKKFKRLGTLFLCATLILSLAACGKSGSETPNATASSASDDTYDEHLTLSWLQAGIKSGADYSADDWGRFWLDKFNVDLILSLLQWILPIGMSVCASGLTPRYARCC